MIGNLTSAFWNRNDPLQPTQEVPLLSLQHLNYLFLLSNYHQQTSAAVCILSLMSKSSSQIWPEQGRENITRNCMSWSQFFTSSLRRLRAISKLGEEEGVQGVQSKQSFQKWQWTCMGTSRAQFQLPPLSQEGAIRGGSCTEAKTTAAFLTAKCKQGKFMHTTWSCLL